MDSEIVHMNQKTDKAYETLHTKKIIIIGLGTGGLFTSRAAASYNKNVKITFIERRDYDMFSPCGLPYALEGIVTNIDDLKHKVPSTKTVRKLLSHEAMSIDKDQKRVRVKNLKLNEEFWLNYDSLIIATGSHPVIPPIPGAQALIGRGVFILSNPENTYELREAAYQSKTAIVVGGNAIGLEAAVALKHLGLDVSITKRTPQPLSNSIDPDMGKIITKYLKSLGLNVLFGKGIDRIIGKEKVEAVEIAGERMSADIVVIAAGVGPNIEVIENTGIATQRGAIVTNQRMETSVDSIYAVGDCCLSFNGFTHEPAKINLATTAQKQAIVAGVNAAGGDAIYDGAYGTFVSKIGELEVACTGNNSMTLNRLGYHVVSGRVKKKVKPSWMPNAKDVTIKILVDEDTGEILGGQAIGEEGAASRINLIALAIKKRMTIQEFSTIELAYCPAISDLYDPLLVVSDIATKRYNNVNQHKIPAKITSSEKITVTGSSSPP